MSASGKSSNRMYDERRWGYEQRRAEPVRRTPVTSAPVPTEPIDWSKFRAEVRAELAAAGRRGVRRAPRAALALAREARRAKRFG